MDQRTPARALAALLLATGLTTGCAGGGGGVHGEPGAAGLRDPYFPRLGNGGYDVRHYALTLGYDPAADRLDGTAEITARATRTLSAFNLDLAGLTVTGATVDGTPAAVHRAGNELTLRPDGDLEQGATFRAVIRYSGTPRAVTGSDGTREGWIRTRDGAVALGQPTGSMTWFPGNHHPSDKATYAVTVTVPDGVEAVSNGELRQRRSANGRTTFVWRSTEPMASYLATLAVGRYAVTSSRTPSGLPVYSAARGATPLLARVAELLEWEEEYFGPYPFSSTGAIVDPTVQVGYALETQNRPVYTNGTLTPEFVVHELAHQWYGNSVSPRSWRDMWLNEGFATYAEWLYAEDYQDVPVRRSFERAYARDDNWAFPPALPPTADHISDDPVYGGGAMVLHKVRQAVGDDTFFGVVRGWAARHRHGNASTDDFTRYVEEESGRDLTEVWDTWLYGGERPPEP
ncbi:M1 family metallopeptidase [Streptomyces sp. HMX112]|uniref:M1 family metallopeptidase n=1 Tax=Streptomyces sp. HMX112 TaxID=3390850 RepID=UPI003A80C9A3